MVAPGTSTSWVTGYVAVALSRVRADARVGPQTRARAGLLATRACTTLQTSARSGCWGWSPRVRPDADSTAWAVRALRGSGLAVPAASIEFLQRHATAAGFRTYETPAVSGRWAAVMPEVTAAVGLALFEAGAIGRAQLTSIWREQLAPVAGPDGFVSHWWPEPTHVTAVVLEAWAAADRPQPDPEVTASWLQVGAGSPADRLWCAAIAGESAGHDHEQLITDLLDTQVPDGSWLAMARLSVPAVREGGFASETVDARGVFSTATALHALLLSPHWSATVTSRSAGHRGRLSRSSTKSVNAARRSTEHDAGLAALARAQGVDVGLAMDTFASLSLESLAEPCPWPSSQLSTLAAGMPVEFSATAQPAVRFTTEVGEPRLAPHRRLASGLAAVTRAAGVLGVCEAWQAAGEVVEILADPRIDVPDGSRFWLWAGVDLHADGPSVLKAYLSLHTADAEGWKARETGALLAAGAPRDSAAFAVIDRLRRDGWCHEIGIGCAANGRWALKVYYELGGWRPELVRDVLSIAGLPTDLEPLTPEIPGVLRAGLAARRRAGIAFRVEPESGQVSDVTVAAAFPVPMAGRDEITRRTREWLLAQGSGTAGLDAAVGVLGPDWQLAPPQLRMLSLFTRTVSARTTSNTVYLRACPPQLRPGRSGSRTSGLPSLTHESASTNDAREPLSVVP